ncbi:MAG TPA: sulfur oxidation c-type cytochrome SoxA [Rhizobacter sp.]
MKATIAALCTLFAAATFAQDTRRSGFDDMGPATQAMQRDDLQNPGMLWVQDGAALWAKPPANGRPACSGCHGAATMSGVAPRYPAFDAVLQRPVTLAQRLNLCRERQQKQPPLAYESAELLALEAFVAHQSRGLPVAPPDDARLQPYRARGEAMYRQRLGQLDLSCAQCHDERAGLRLGGNRIPQGHANGYPLYRLEWQSLGSLQRRLRNCLTGVRAEPYAYGDMALIELELYLARRGQGLTIETPAVRP